MDNLLLCWLLVTGLIFVGAGLGAMSVSSAGGNPRLAAVVALLSPLWPLWPVVLLVWLVRAAFGKEG